VQNGRPAIDAVSEGDMVPSDWSFEYAWAEQRQARTIVGINAKGDLLMVTVDGRQPGVSEGATLTGEAALMKSLGAVSAMNLDGGGSTDFTVDGKQVNSPAYATGERLVGGYLVVLPKR
jgi:exopolysaccharide biosynthesis protein